MVLEKAEGGFFMGASCFWESVQDGNYCKKYDFKEFYIICNFFGVTPS